MIKIDSIGKSEFGLTDQELEGEVQRFLAKNKVEESDIINIFYDPLGGDYKVVYRPGFTALLKEGLFDRLLGNKNTSGK